MTVSENTLLTITGAIKATNDKETLAQKILMAISTESEDESIRDKALSVIIA